VNLAAQAGLSACYLPAPLARQAGAQAGATALLARSAGAAGVMAQRKAVVDEARSWLRTPYVHMGRRKGAGVDCATLLCEVFERAGVVPHVELEWYPPDWYLHRDEERYLVMVGRYAARVLNGRPMPGDIALYKYGRCVSHGAIVLDWPLVVHAWRAAGKVVLADAAKAPLSARFHSLWSAWEAAWGRPAPALQAGRAG
jgi:cell wall-associated NlpC family hydrolase